MDVEKSAGPDNVPCPCRAEFCEKYLIDIDTNTLISISVPKETFFDTQFMKSVVTETLITHQVKISNLIFQLLYIFTDSCYMSSFCVRKLDLFYFF